MLPTTATWTLQAKLVIQYGMALTLYQTARGTMLRTSEVFVNEQDFQMKLHQNCDSKIPPTVKRKWCKEEKERGA